MTNVRKRIGRAICAGTLVASWTSADVWAQPAPPPPETVGVAASFEQLRVVAGAWLWIVGANAVFGAGVGVGIDALIKGDHVIYQPRPRSAVSGLAIRPLLARGRAGISWSMGF